MRRLQSFLFNLSLPVLAVLIQPPTTVWGQCPYMEQVIGYFVATYDGSAMQLRLDLATPYWGPRTYRGNAVALDVYRKTLGYECGPQVRVTDEPIAWPTECEPFSANFTDPNVSLDTAYQYEARPVDAEGNPARELGVFPVDPFVTYGVAGTALLAHGTLNRAYNYRTFISTCPGECLASGMLPTRPTDPSLDLEAPVIVYGNGAGGTYSTNELATELFATSIRNAPCLVAVESVGWDAVKRLYK